jgi:hypothetical protein
MRARRGDRGRADGAGQAVIDSFADLSELLDAA